jgi:hypothetical protein
MNTIMRTVGGAVGGQLSAAVLTAHLDLNDEITDAGFTAAFWVITISLVAAAAFVLLLPGRARRAPAPVEVPATGADEVEVPEGLAFEAAVGPGAGSEPGLHPALLSGRVRRDGVHVPAAILTVIAGDGREVLHTRADDAGEFRLDVPSGRYYVVVTDDGRDPRAVGVLVNGHPVRLDLTLPGPGAPGGRHHNGPAPQEGSHSGLVRRS